ncbi:hypothetical protein QBC40DRAFT_307343 [Triangularia verruculosa]|uniref:Uncharacterized protein n=1 Tax=Triangularia verruculosa TaxID=2587418 RepID=A0AAN7AUJ8_9PEZI|nr:hypothetical protein QBC40DRAFT_307343 [Triangularia verruculosa]
MSNFCFWPEILKMRRPTGPVTNRLGTIGPPDCRNGWTWFSSGFHAVPGPVGSLLQCGCLVLRQNRAAVLEVCILLTDSTAERPCNRCVSQNKSDQCVDVQHKKRGRPRLRDDTQTRYESGGRLGSAADAMRRPLTSVYGSGSSMGMVQSDSLRRTQSYRVLKSQPAESIAPRFLERGLAADANIFPAPLSISTTRVPEEPVAYLRIVGLEFLKASGTFYNAIGRSSRTGFKLLEDVLAPGDRNKAERIDRQTKEEQRNREFGQLPAMTTVDEQAKFAQRLGFGADDIARYQTDWRVEHLTFEGEDGQPRPFSTRFGLVKEDSVWFVVLILQIPPPRPYQYPTPSPNPRDNTYAYQPTPLSFSQPTPMSATFDPRQSRLGEPSPYGPRQPMGIGAPPPPLMAGRSPSLPLGYAPSPSRPSYPEASYQVPRSEMQPSSRPPQMQGYQLPPLVLGPPGGLSQPLAQDRGQQSRGERPRVDIGGLLDHPGPPRDPPPPQQ